MSFPLQNRKIKKTPAKKLFVGVVLIVLFLFGINYVSGGFVSSVIRTPALALWGAQTAVNDTLDSTKNSIISKETLLKERDLLKERVRDLELYALNNLVLVAENRELQKLLGSENVSRRSGTLARVVSHGGEFPYGSIAIQSESGVPLQVGAPVFGAQNIILGFVSRDDFGKELITLLSAPQVETQVLIGTDERITQALVVGSGNGNMTAKIPRDADIRVDDPVVLFVGETALVGFVGVVEMEPTDAFQLVRVRTPLNIGTIRFVHVR